MRTASLPLFLIIAVFTFTAAYAQNPTVVNGVATYNADINIGRKFQVPDTWNKILIKANVTVTGSFYFPTRTTPMEIAGESRTTSIIKGDGTRPTDDGIMGRSYSAIRFDQAPDVYVHDLRSLDPMKFHIAGGFGKVIVERCDLIETRGEHTTDGVHGGDQSVIVRDCYINTWDDALYTRECVLVENTTIVHNKNGAPFMTSWGAAAEKNYTCVIRNCSVIDNDTQYNHGVVAWAGKSHDYAQTINLKFQGTFSKTTATGKTASYMYTIGRTSGSSLSNATINVDGLCPNQSSIEYRTGTSNCSVVFNNCSSVGALPIPGLMEAEHYTNSSGIDTEDATDWGGGKNVGWIHNGDWTEYDVDVLYTSSYEAAFRVASGTSGGTITLKSGSTVLGSVTVPGTSGWQNWTTVTTDINLSAGSHTLKLEYSGGTGFLFNVNWVDFNTNSTAPIGDQITLEGNNLKYVCSENGVSGIICDRASVGAWEKFTVVDAGNGKIALKGNNGKYVNDGSPMWCTETTITNAAKFTWVDAGNGKIAFQGNNGKYVCSENGATAMNCSRNGYGSWETFICNVLPKSAETLPEGNFTDNELNIYPNPASDVINIKAKGTVNVSIYNLQGKMIYANIFEEFGSIDASELGGSGVYLVHSNNSVQKLIVK
ncbi:MAG: carbohydrate-binding protein [Bacteroidales bacterium]|nr:carbohydrate-binding protein [Bacteroidales bacterium]